VAYLLDTNAGVDYLTGRYPNVVARIQECPPDDLRLSVVVVVELIAAHALSRGLTVATDDTEEFERVKGLKVENWRE
jgi:predicted nucleic acid-binding protein